MANLPRILKAMRLVSTTVDDDLVVEEDAVLQVYSWVNVFHSSGPYAKETFVGQLHDHQWPFHGFFIWNGSRTNTSFLGLTGHLFNVVNENNALVLLPGG